MTTPTLPTITNFKRPKTDAEWQQFLNTLQQWAQTILSLAPPAVYDPTFQSGQVVYVGPNNVPAGSNDMIFGLAIPTPASPYPGGGPALLLGSGGGSFTASISGYTMSVTAVPTGTVIPVGATVTGVGVSTGTLVTAVPGGGSQSSATGAYTVNNSQSVSSETMAASAQFWIVQDAAFDDLTPGDSLGISAGESDGAQPGGQLTLIGGGSASGAGGLLQLQGGTSASGAGGEAVLQGGNSTSGAAGDAFVSGGQAGDAGANVHLIATLVNGVSGVVRLRQNSNIMIDFTPEGAASAGSVGVGMNIYKGNGLGLAGQPLVSGGVSGTMTWQAGFTGTITTAKLTTATGSMTFASGILISQVAAT